MFEPLNQSRSLAKGLVSVGEPFSRQTFTTYEPAKMNGSVLAAKMIIVVNH